MSNNAHELSKRLLNALDSNYNVVDMHAVNEIISILEKINITKELLETTRLGKHVNELRRRTTDAALARRAKVLVKRWRDLVIPNAVASPAHAGSSRSSAERAVRGVRLGGTPLTSPALPLSRQVLSPVVISSPRPSSRPAWGGYESDSQDVILVDDDPPPPPAPSALAASRPHTPSKRLASPTPSVDEKKAKRDKKPKKKRGHSRAGTGAETVCEGPAAGGGAGGTWGARNGVSPSAHLAAHDAMPPSLASTNATAPARRNGCRRSAVDAYAALVNKIPAAGVKKVKTTQELLEEIQSRGRPASPASPASPHSPDVVLVEPEPSPIEVESPLRNGGSEPVGLSPSVDASSLAGRSPPPPSRPALEDERPYTECTCGDEPDEACPAALAQRTPLAPRHVHALHHTLLPGVNGTRAPLHPHRFAVRPAIDPDRPELFANVVPLYKYSDYADDYCVKNLARVPLASHLPWTEFAPPPPDPPPPPAPPPPRPYPLSPAPPSPASSCSPPHLKSEPTTPPDACDRLETPADTYSDEDEGESRPATRSKDPTSDIKRKPSVSEFQSEAPDHRTVERAKAPPTPGTPHTNPVPPDTEELSGRMIYELWERARAAAVYGYEQASAAPATALRAPAVAYDETLQAALDAAAEGTVRDALGRPLRHVQFAEWHECAQLGDLVALPYVVID